MGLYCGIATFWLIGILKPNYWQPATMLNILFMLGLAAGRVVSMVVDGMPSNGMLFGLGLEATLGLWGIASLRKYV